MANVYLQCQLNVADLVISTFQSIFGAQTQTNVLIRQLLTARLLTQQNLYFVRHKINSLLINMNVAKT